MATICDEYKDNDEGIPTDKLAYSMWRKCEAYKPYFNKYGIPEEPTGWSHSDGQTKWSPTIHHEPFDRWAYEKWVGMTPEDKHPWLNLASNVPVKNLQEPHYRKVCLGHKTVEARLRTDELGGDTFGSWIRFNSDNDPEGVVFQIVDTQFFPTFEAMLGVVPLNQVLPGVKTVADGVEIYKGIYGNRDLTERVVAVRVVRIYQ